MSLVNCSMILEVDTVMLWRSELVGDEKWLKIKLRQR